MLEQSQVWNPCEILWIFYTNNYLYNKLKDKLQTVDIFPFIPKLEADVSSETLVSNCHLIWCHGHHSENFKVLKKIQIPSLSDDNADCCYITRNLMNSIFIDGNQNPHTEDLVGQTGDFPSVLLPALGMTQPQKYFWVRYPPGNGIYSHYCIRQKQV
jgi:hypothetical protein